MRKFLLLLTMSLFLALVGCSSTEEKENTATEETASVELTDQVKGKLFNTVRVAELKVNEVFTKETAADEVTPVMTSTFVGENGDVTPAVEFLSKYYSEDVATKIIDHYNTTETTEEGQIIVKADPFFVPSMLEAKQEDVTVEGDANKATVKTAEGVTYTVELIDEKYVVTNVE